MRQGALSAAGPGPRTGAGVVVIGQINVKLSMQARKKAVHVAGGRSERTRCSGARAPGVHAVACTRAAPDALMGAADTTHAHQTAGLHSARGSRRCGRWALATARAAATRLAAGRASNRSSLAPTRTLTYMITWSVWMPTSFRQR